MNPIIIELLQAVHKFYPVGLPQIYPKYPGYISMSKIVEKKINDLIDEKETDWTRLMNDIAAQFPSSQIFDFGHFQFPNYFFEMDLGSEKNLNFEVTKKVCVVISLVVNYYTIFFKDSFDFISEEIGKSISFKHIYNKSNKNSDDLEVLRQLTSVTGRKFQNHIFIDHKLLFDYKLEGGVIYGMMEEYSPLNQYSFYDYLFSSDLQTFQFQIDK